MTAKQLNQIVNLQAVKSHTKCSNYAPKNTRTIPDYVHEIFSRFTTIYQDGWTKNFLKDGKVNPDLFIAFKLEWAETLERINFNENESNLIREAISDVKITFPSFPPKVGEFHALVLEKARAFAHQKAMDTRIREESRLPSRKSALGCKEIDAIFEKGRSMTREEHMAVLRNSA